MKVLKKFFLNRTLLLISINILFIIILISVDSSGFLSRINIFGILYSIAANMIILGAMTSLMISGGIDLSVGSIIAFSALIFGKLFKLGVPIPVAIIGSLITGILIGIINGYVIAYLGINAFITTLSGWFVLRSLVLLVSRSTEISGFPPSFGMISSYKVLNVPIFVIFAFICVIIFEALMKKNKFFRQNFNIGGNETAAALIGIKVKKVKLINYVIIGLMAAVAGIFLTSRYMSFVPEIGSNTAFSLITAIIIGGASLTGGEGSVMRSVLGLLFVSLIYDAIVIFGVDIRWNDAFIGAALIIMILLNAKTSRLSKLK